MNRAFACAGAVALSTCSLLYAQNGCVSFMYNGGMDGALTITVPSPDSGIPNSVIDAACSRWNTSCPQAGYSFPLLYAGCGGDISVEIHHYYMSEDETCGNTLDALGPG